MTRTLAPHVNQLVEIAYAFGLDALKIRLFEVSGTAAVEKENVFLAWLHIFFPSSLEKS